MVKALAFKGDKKVPKKQKRTANEYDDNLPPTSKQLTTTTAPVEDQTDDDQWVSAEALADIAGPIIFVLPTSPPTSLSCDQMGKVFPQKIENLVEGLPDSAEPHDVRQVWVTTRVVGSEGNFTFKGHHGRYLGGDQYGICSATREAISPEETFALQLAEPDGIPNGLFAIRTARSTFLSSTISSSKDMPEVRGDATEANGDTHVRIRMQARFKPKHKVEKAEKVRAKISRKELEEEVGRRLEDEEVRGLKKARRDGDYHEVMLDVKVKGKHDKYA